MSLLTMIVKGGWLMIFLALALFLLITLVVERTLVLRRTGRHVDFLTGRMKSLLPRGSLSEAIRFCEGFPGIMSSILKEGLLNHPSGKEEMEKAMQRKSRSEIQHLEKNLWWIASIAAAAPMIGFLGTVTGMIRAFMKIQTLGGNVNASVLAGGIWEALITTAGGLLVGIPALILYNYFTGKIDSLETKMESLAGEVVETLNRKEAQEKGGER